MGQKSKFNQEDADTICAALAEGHSLLSICEAMGIPVSTARQWEFDIPEHAANAARAREMGCHALADQALQIADTPHLGVIRTTKPDGGVEERFEDMTSHRKLQIDTRKWLLSRWLPKVYGDRTTVAGDPEAPIETKQTLDASSLPTEVLAAIMKAKDTNGNSV